MYTNRAVGLWLTQHCVGLGALLKTFFGLRTGWIFYLFKTRFLTMNSFEFFIYWKQVFWLWTAFYNLLTTFFWTMNSFDLKLAQDRQVFWLWTALNFFISWTQIFWLWTALIFLFIENRFFDYEQLWILFLKTDFLTMNSFDFLYIENRFFGYEQLWNFYLLKTGSLTMSSFEFFLY